MHQHRLVFWSNRFYWSIPILSNSEAPDLTWVVRDPTLLFSASSLANVEEYLVKYITQLIYMYNIRSREGPNIIVPASNLAVEVYLIKYITQLTYMYVQHYARYMPSIVQEGCPLHFSPTRSKYHYTFNYLMFLVTKMSAFWTWMSRMSVGCVV